jgi:hypothetical protein
MHHGFLLDQNFLEKPFLKLREALCLLNLNIKLYTGINAFKDVASSQIIILTEFVETPKNYIEVYNSKKSWENSDKYPREILMSERITFTNDSTTYNKVLEKLKIKFNLDFKAQYGAEIGGKKYSYPYFVFDDKKNDGDYIPLANLSKSKFFPFCDVQYVGYIRYDSELSIKVRTKYSKLNVALRDRDLWRKPRLIMRQSCLYNSATFTSKENISLLNSFIITHKQNDVNSLKILLGLINSNVFTYYFIKAGVIRTGEGKQPQIRSADLNSILIPEINNSDKLRILDQVNKLLGNKNRDNKFVFGDLNSIIYRLFNLNENDLEEIESRIF